MGFGWWGLWMLRGLCFGVSFAVWRPFVALAPLEQIPNPVKGRGYNSEGVSVGLSSEKESSSFFSCGVFALNGYPCMGAFLWLRVWRE
jgi:hypothetical protein